MLGGLKEKDTREEKTRVLVVDDEPQNLRLIEVKLRQEYEIIIVDSGKEALRLLDDGERFDVILLDQMMPEMDGIATFAEMQRQKLVEDVPVIMVTAHGSIKLVTTFMQMGGADFVEKPVFDVEVLKLKIAHALRTAEIVRRQQRIETELARVQRLESIGILAGGIAHDFNNFLTGILGNISLARMRGDSEDEIIERLMEAEKASLRARDLTQQLLTFAKGGELAKNIASIVDLLKDAASFALSGSNVKCQFFITDKLWPVEIDEGQINQVTSNIVINAGQATPNGGAIKLYAENMIVGSEHALPLPDGKYVKISIEDKGVGIPQEHLQQIFEPYFTTKQTGSGLGLATAYSIIKKHDGHITVESQTGVGTTFHAYLPAFPDETFTAEEDEVRITETGEGRILVMDDEDMVRKVLRDTLAVFGYEVTTAADGTTAIELYKEAAKSGNPFVAVIMDLTIPGGMGGMEAIQKLTEFDPDVKAVVSSGYSNDPIMTNFRECGFCGVIAKPYKMSKLNTVLHNVINGNSG